MTYEKDGVPFDIHVEHVIGTMRYPAGWFYDPAAREAMGIVEVPGDDPGEQPPTAPPVPEAVAMWQARAILIEDDLLDDVNAVLAAIPDEKTRKLAQAKFEYSSTVRRDDPLVTEVFPTLGKTEADIDAMFRRAAGVL